LLDTTYERKLLEHMIVLLHRLEQRIEVIERKLPANKGKKNQVKLTKEELVPFFTENKNTSNLILYP